MGEKEEKTVGLPMPEISVQNTKVHIAPLFDRIAGTYDRFNHLLSLNIDKRWRKKAVRRLRPSDEVLDVAVGTADLALEILRQGKARKVLGIDLSSEMMRIGREKAEKEGRTATLSFLQADAMDMPFADESFDAVCCAYGLRNFSDLDRGLSEMFRVLKNGGQLVILEFSYPSRRLFRVLYDFFFTRIMPALGKKISKDDTAYLYFRESVKNFIWGEAMLSHLRRAGFGNESFRPFSMGITTLYLAEKKEAVFSDKKHTTD